jgi:protein-disulfide isomerase
VIVLIAVSTTGGDSKSSGEVVGIEDATALFAGIPQKGLEIGKADAPVTIVEYLDVQCPHCANAATSIVPELVDQFVKPGQAKLKLQPIAFIGDDSTKGALVVIAAGDQNRAGEYAEVLFRNQGAENSGWLTDSMIDDIAAGLGMDTAKLNDDRKGDAAQTEFEAIAAAATTDAVQSTPTFLIKGSKGQYEIKNRENLSEFTQAIAAVK